MNARDPSHPMGLVLDMPFEQYLAVNAFSNSDMKLLARSPWHWKNRLPVVQTRPMLRGSLAHCAILEPDAVGARYVYVPEDAPKRPTPAQWAAKQSNESSTQAKEWWTRFNDYASERQIVEFKDMEITRAQLAAIKEEPTLSPLFASGHSEVSLFWIDAETGIYCKARPDHLHYLTKTRVKALDLKSCADESPRGFGTAIARMGYHRQQAHYEAGIAACGLEVDEFLFAAVTSAKPVLAMPYRIPQPFALQGRDEVRELIELYADCLHDNEWPRYGGTGTQEADVPVFAYRSSEVEVAFAED